MVNAVLSHHIDGAPRYLSASANVRASSVVEIITRKEYDELSVSDILSKLIHRNIVLIDNDIVNCDFNEDTLGLLGSLEASINIHGQLLVLSYSFLLSMTIVL